MRPYHMFVVALALAAPTLGACSWTPEQQARMSMALQQWGHGMMQVSQPQPYAVQAPTAHRYIVNGRVLNCTTSLGTTRCF